MITALVLLIGLSAGVGIGYALGSWVTTRRAVHMWRESRVAYER